MEYGTRITEAGAALIAACILAGGKQPITEAAVGDGGGAPYEPDRRQTALRGERWRGGIAGAERDPAAKNLINITIILPEGVGGFVIREIGLFSAEGVLVAVCNTPDTEKLSAGQGVSGKLTILMRLLVEDASVLEFTVKSALDGVSREELTAALAVHDRDPLAHPPLREGIAGLDARLSLLELLYATDVSGNPFTVTFESLEGLAVTGTWNAPLKRVEF